MSDCDVYSCCWWLLVLSSLPAAHSTSHVTIHYKSHPNRPRYHIQLHSIDDRLTLLGPSPNGIHSAMWCRENWMPHGHQADVCLFVRKLCIEAANITHGIIIKNHQSNNMPSNMHSSINVIHMLFSWSTMALGISLAWSRRYAAAAHASTFESSVVCDELWCTFLATPRCASNSITWAYTTSLPHTHTHKHITHLRVHTPKSNYCNSLGTTLHSKMDQSNTFSHKYADMCHA